MSCCYQKLSSGSHFPTLSRGRNVYSKGDMRDSCCSPWQPCISTLCMAALPCRCWVVHLELSATDLCPVLAVAGWALCCRSHLACQPAGCVNILSSRLRWPQRSRATHLTASASALLTSSRRAGGSWRQQYHEWSCGEPAAVLLSPHSVGCWIHAVSKAPHLQAERRSQLAGDFAGVSRREFGAISVCFTVENWASNRNLWSVHLYLKF